MSLDKVASWLVIIGALNWLLVGLGGFFGGNWNVVWMLLGTWPAVMNIVYVLVGLSGVHMLVNMLKE
ncbi:MAG: uncharacterized membrane protein YuzA (DUF378 family) [Patescibacteria group bacterium]|jgi:uncharacterized membrane protein YuzA (DUF378 family)